MHKPSPFILIVVAAVLAFVGYLLWQIPAKARYTKLLDQLAQAPRFVAHPMDEESAALLDSVESSWQLHTNDSPDPVFAEIASVTRFENSVAGVVALYTHRVPEYSFFNRERNKRESVLATTLAIALPVSMDSRVYHKDGMAFVRIADSVIEVFEDTDKGISRRLYMKPKEPEAEQR